MLIEEKVYALLSANAAVTAIVPSDRIKVPANHQNLERPYVVHFPVSHDSNYTHGGRTALKAWPFYQVSCFADEYSTARNLAVAVAEALSGNHDGCNFFVRNQTAMYDSEVNVHHIAVDFQVFETL
jgi:hypothetical protein